MQQNPLIVIIIIVGAVALIWYLNTQGYLPKIFGPRTPAEKAKEEVSQDIQEKKDQVDKQSEDLHKEIDQKADEVKQELDKEEEIKHNDIDIKESMVPRDINSSLNMGGRPPFPHPI